MMKTLLLLTAASLTACGYKMVGWDSRAYETMAIRPVRGSDAETRRMGVRLRDALIESCLAGSALRPTETEGSLILETNLYEYKEDVVATDLDGRTLRIQFSMLATFMVRDAAGKVVWSLDNYRYSDQYNLATGRDAYRDEAVFIQDEALDDIADLVIANITLAIAELETDDE